MNRNMAHKILLVIILATVMGMGSMAGEGRQSENSLIDPAPTASAVQVAANPHRVCISEKVYDSVAAVTPPKRHQVAAMLIEE